MLVFPNTFWVLELEISGLCRFTAIDTNLFPLKSMLAFKDASFFCALFCLSSLIPDSCNRNNCFSVSQTRSTLLFLVTPFSSSTGKTTSDSQASTVSVTQDAASCAIFFSTKSHDNSQGLLFPTTRIFERKFPWNKN